MSTRIAFMTAPVIIAITVATSGQHRHLNPMIDLLEQHKPIFGLYQPSATPRPSGQRMPLSTADQGRAKTPIELAMETMTNGHSDFVFNGSMEEGLDHGLAAFTEFVKAMGEAGPLAPQPYLHFPHPLIVKTPKIARDPMKAIDNISRQLNTGVSGIMFVEVESAEEVRQGLAAMRFKSKGGTRPDDVGMAPAYWGLTAQQYKEQADLWPLNPDGELVNWTIVESKAGLAHVREIAAVKGIGVLWPGAGTLREVFTTTNAAGERVFDATGWEGAIQQVLAACMEFHVPCGYPANADNIETRMKQGFSVFVMPWNDSGFTAVEIGRTAGGRQRGRP